MLENEDAFATSLLAIALDEYGTDVLSWDPETLWMELAEDFSARIPRVNKDKLQALITCYTTNLFFVSLEFFITTCNVLSGAEANFSKFDPADSEEIIWAVYEIMLNTSIDRDKNDKEDYHFSHEIRRYMGIALENDGVFDPPDVLRVAEMTDRTNLDLWQDEPDMYNAAFDKSKAEKVALLSFLGSRLLELLKELNDVVPKLRNYEPSSWQKFKTAVETNAKKLSVETSKAMVHN